jgi:hypothetical protein
MMGSEIPNARFIREKNVTTLLCPSIEEKARKEGRKFHLLRRSATKLAVFSSHKNWTALKHMIQQKLYWET